jgi:hypothetical protein
LARIDITRASRPATNLPAKEQDLVSNPLPEKPCNRIYDVALSLV